MGHPRRSLDTVLAVSTVILLVLASAGIVSAQGRVKQVRAVVNGTAQLPCDITPPAPGDSVLLVIWFKNEKTAIYSYDARRKSWDGPAGPHWKHPQLLGERGFFRTVATPAALSLSDVAESDEGVYRCRVDFRRSASRIQRVRLTVIVPPQRPKIYDERGVEVGPVAGPYHEGGQARLTCVVYGGRPPPELRWWRGERLLESRELPAGPRIRERLLLLPRLSRQDLHSELSCQAANSNLTLPAEARVALDINFRPLSTSILSSEQPLTAGRRYDIACRTVGSRPPAVVSWWLDNTRLPASTDQVSADGNETISTLSLTPEPTDDGRLLTCRAENPQVLGGIEEHSVRLSVYYAPSTELRLGPRLQADDVEEGSDVYFECHVRANPPAYKIFWKFEGKTLSQNHSAGVIMTRGALALQSVSRRNAGGYSCVASNVEGDGESPPLRLRIKYKPVCRPGQRRVYAVARHEQALVRCEVEAFPAAAGFRWAFNNSAETLDVPQARFNWSAADGASLLAHAPVNDLDYGSVLCWADNAVGQQLRPCVFHIVPAGQPDVPTNCSVSNQTSQSVVVRCSAGFDGGQPQSFLLEVLEAASGHQLFNMTQLRPLFVVDGLAAGQLLQLRVSAVNAKGRSDSVTLDAATLMPPEMRASGVPLSLDVPTAVGALLGLVSALLLLSVVAAAWLLHRRRRRRRREGEPPAAELALKKKAAAAAAAAAATAAELSDKDDRNPDVVPAYCDDWSETDAASSSRGTPVVPGPELPRDAERPLHPAPAWEVFKVCPAVCDAYVPHPATLRRPPASRLQQAGVRPEVTYAELRLPPLQAGPPMRRYYRHEPVVYAQIAHAPPPPQLPLPLPTPTPTTTSVATSTSDGSGACALRAASPQQLQIHHHQQDQQEQQESREVVTVRTPLMVGQQESCV